MIGLLTLLVVTGICAWALSFRPDLAGDVETLRQLPSELAGWQAVDIPMEKDVADMLRADANVQRAYVHSLGYVIFVYVGYYGTARGGTPEHTPEVCYPAQGWDVVESVSVDLGGESELSAREFVIEKNGEQRLVHFWYRTEDKTGIQSTASLRWRHFWSQLAAGRGDGALVRLDTSIEYGDVDGARQKLVAMDRALESALGAVWPTESVAEPGAS